MYCDLMFVLSCKQNRAYEILYLTSGVKIYFGDIFPVRRVTITIEYENSDQLSETTSLSLINSDNTETNTYSLSNPTSITNLSATTTPQVYRYKIYCEDKESIGIRIWKVENVGLWCLSEVAARVKRADADLSQPGR